MNEIKKLREKYNMYLSKRDYTKAVEVMKKINSLSQIYEERREVAVKSLFDSLSEEDVNKATEYMQIFYKVRQQICNLF